MRNISAENIDKKTFDPSPNILGRHPQMTAMGCVILGAALTSNIIRSQNIRSLHLTIPFLLKVFTTIGLFSSAHAFAFDCKPKTSRFPFGHTSSKEVIFGSMMFGSALLLSRDMLSRNVFEKPPAYFLAMMTMKFLFSGMLFYAGGKLIADGFGLPVSTPEDKLFAEECQDLAGNVDQPSCFSVKAVSSLEVFGERNYRVWRIPHLLTAEAVTDPSLKTIEATQIFKTGTVAFGFGKPNVFLMRINDGVTQRVDAKSFWRDSTKITTSDAHGKIQSGVFFVPRYLDNETIQKLETEAFNAVGKSGPTCAQINAHILHAAGFSLGNDAVISGSILPHTLLGNILKHGLLCDGKKVEFDIVCTTEDKNLAAFYQALSDAEVKTPCRHATRNAASHDEAGRTKRIDAAKAVHFSNERNLLPLTEVQSPSAGQSFKVWGSKPSALGMLARAVWGAHVVYRIGFNSTINVDDFLPNDLLAFPQTHPSTMTLFKRDVLFCPMSLKHINKNMAPTFECMGIFFEGRVVELLHNGLIRNFVLTKNELVLMHLGESSSWADWALSKHVLAATAIGSSCEKDGRGFPIVRFAGELRYDALQNTLYINANSGTYMPTDEDLENAVKLAKKMLPTVNIVAIPSNELSAFNVSPKRSA